MFVALVPFLVVVVMVVVSGCVVGVLRWCCCRFDARSMLSGEIVCQYSCPDSDSATVRDLKRGVHQLSAIRYTQAVVIHGPAIGPLPEELCVWGAEVPEVVVPRVRLRQKTSRSHVSLQKYFPQI